jgi:NADPH:quinone reductase-like Zn-dependent oxidoreductase
VSAEHEHPAKTMKAWVSYEFEPPERLRLEEVPVPAVGDDQVLVRVRAAGLNPYDWRLLRGDPVVARRMMKGIRPKGQAFIPGADMAGVIESVGSAVTSFRPGDEVYGEAGAGCLAEYVIVAQDQIVLKPARLGFEQAAAVPMAAMTAFQGLRAGGIEKGQRTLINGAGGGIGTFAVQIAKALGAEVTGVCSPAKVEPVRSLGADQVVDRTREDFARRGERYDLLLDSIGDRSLRALRRALTSQGTLVVVGGFGGRWLGPLPQMARAMLLSRLLRRQRIAIVATKPDTETLESLNELIEAGKVTPVVGRSFPFAEAPEAIRCLEQDRPLGKVVVSL